MPFFYDETNIEYPEDGSDPPPPRPDQFQYMTATEYGGPRAPARFSIAPIGTIVEPPVQGLPSQAPAERRGILKSLFGWTNSAGRQQKPQERLQDSMRRQRLEWERRTQQLFSTLIPPLRELGVRRAYCRYDGGNDEGFVWLDHYEREGGERIEVDALANNLGETEVFEKLRAAGLTNHLRATSVEQKTEGLKRFLSDELVSEWASILLGGSFGAGEYSMYGAFTADLQECTIIDDPLADPVVENIKIAS